MIDYDNPKHLKLLFIVLAIFSIPLGIYGVYLAINALSDGFIYISNRNFKGDIYFNKNPYKFSFFVSVLGLGGGAGLWSGMHLFFTVLKLNKSNK